MADLPTAPLPSPPAGPRDPALLQVARYLRDPTGHLEACRATWGPVFTLRWPGMPPMVYFTDLDAVREIFAAPADVLAAGHSNAVLDFIAGPRSVARLDGEDHKQRRRASRGRATTPLSLASTASRPPPPTGSRPPPAPRS